MGQAGTSSGDDQAKLGHGRRLGWVGLGWTEPERDLRFGNGGSTGPVGREWKERRVRRLQREPVNAEDEGT